MNEVVFESLILLLTDFLLQSLTLEEVLATGNQSKRTVNFSRFEHYRKIGDNLSTQLNQIYNKALVVFRLSMHECYV